MFPNYRLFNCIYATKHVPRNALERNIFDTLIYFINKPLIDSRVTEI